MCRFFWNSLEINFDLKTHIPHVHEEHIASTIRCDANLLKEERYFDQGIIDRVF
jgi:hypothetical protein